MSGSRPSARRARPLPVDDEGSSRAEQRTLGIEAFGTNAYTAEGRPARVVEEHTEATSGHEELYVVVSGRATFTIDGEEVDAPAGTLVFVKPATARRGRAEDGTTVLDPAGIVGEALHDLAWEADLRRARLPGAASPERGRRAAGGRERRPDAWQGPLPPRLLRGARRRRREALASTCAARSS